MTWNIPLVIFGIRGTLKFFSDGFEIIDNLDPEISKTFSLF